MTGTATDSKTSCFHCGEDCPADAPKSDDKSFCCRGCQAVYELLNENDLETYYTLQQSPGRSPARTAEDNRFDYLDDPAMVKRILDFDDGRKGRVTFNIPQMHCASCIWLLENLYRLHPGVTASRVSFLEKQLSVSFDRDELTLSKLTGLLASIGYEPEISLNTLDRTIVPDRRGSLHRKIGVAGFCFGNIMLFSLPHYFAADGFFPPSFQRLFGYLGALLALPVLLYSASDYLKSAVTGLRQKNINMDVPISIGILILFIRSNYEIFMLGGSGYFDSFAGLVFFLLVGRLFQQKTFDAIAFDRDYKSFFPLSVRTIRKGIERFISVTDLVVSDRVLIRNGELIPADSVLIAGQARIDYSFVTGESEPVNKAVGTKIYAGGRQCGGMIELEVVKEVSQSYLTRLWNETDDQKAGTDHYRANITTLANRISKYFTLTVLGIAAFTAVYWIIVNSALAANAATAVLIIACPCALALSTPFTLGTVMRILGKAGLYLKNSQVVETMSTCHSIVLDKTGTLTSASKARVNFIGTELSDEETSMVSTLTKHSAHPLSRKIFDSFGGVETFQLSDYSEQPGIGVKGIINGHQVRIGSAKWAGFERNEELAFNLAHVYVSIDSQPRGWFEVSSSYRIGIESVMNDMVNEFGVTILSGDNEAERSNLEKLLSNQTEIRFRQSPHDKKDFIHKIQQDGKRVIMIGDGLNDAGALSEAAVGIAVTEDVSTFSPACDAILDGKDFGRLHRMLALTRKSMLVIKSSFVISFAYNIIGIGFAVTGDLSPLVSAILMPISSVSVVLFTTISTAWLARREGL